MADLLADVWQKPTIFVKQLALQLKIIKKNKTGKELRICQERKRLSSFPAEGALAQECGGGSWGPTSPMHVVTREVELCGAWARAEKQVSQAG